MNDLESILAHYDTGVERNRLNEGVGKLELLRTRELIERYLPSKRCSIAHIGAGAGIYSYWLREQGHDTSPGSDAGNRRLRPGTE